MEYPKIENIQENLTWLFNFFFVGYFGLYCLFEPYFLNYDILTRIILSVILSYLLIASYGTISAITFFKFWNRETQKLRNTIIEIDVESEHAAILNISLFGVFKMLYIFKIIQYDSISLMISFIVILMFQPIVGIVDGYSVYVREINKLKTDIKLGRLKKYTEHEP
ncbi:MAG: hypothetical protein GQ533_00825 [Methanosarcinaceae archaeon]|nr:hypothetical protein [Methanosarcinaceae archaeon]